MHGEYPYRGPIERAVRLVMDRQLPVCYTCTHVVPSLTLPQDGSWAQEAIEGIFNKTCTISYPNFKFSFTIWMLGKAHHYLAELDK